MVTQQIIELDFSKPEYSGQAARICNLAIKQENLTVLGHVLHTDSVGLVPDDQSLGGRTVQLRTLRQCQYSRDELRTSAKRKFIVQSSRHQGCANHTQSNFVWTVHRSIKSNSILNAGTRWFRDSMVPVLRSLQHVYSKPDVTAKIMQLIGSDIKLRADSFVIETNIHCPTESSLIRDGLRKIPEICSELAVGDGIVGWRQHQHLWKRVKQLAREIDRIAAKKGANHVGRMKAPYRELREQARLITERARQICDILILPNATAADIFGPRRIPPYQTIRSEPHFTEPHLLR